MTHGPVAKLKKDLHDRISRFERRRCVFRRWALGVRWVTIGCSVATTVLVGLKGYDQYQYALSNWALAFSAVVSGLSAYEAFRSDQRLWVSFATAKARLERLLFAVEAWEVAGHDRQPERVQDFLDRYDKILDEAYLTWAEATLPPRAADETKGKTPKPPDPAAGP